MKRLLTIAALVLGACGEPDRYPKELVCLPACPPKWAVHDEVDRVYARFEPFVDTPNWAGWQIEFSDHEAVLNDRPVYGATWHVGQKIWVWYDYDCGASIQGICPGVLEWELGLVQIEKILPGSTEAEKIQWYNANILKRGGQQISEIGR